MLSLKFSLPLLTKKCDSMTISMRPRNTVVCAAKGPRPRYPRVWKSKKKIGSISKSAKLVECIKGLSNVKEDVYGALDSFVAWELEFPLIVVKKALNMLENKREWKRIIQVTKWMLSKGQGRTMGTYFTLLNALEEDGRLDEAEELWSKLFAENLESMPRMFFAKMIGIYYKRGMHDKMFELFADMEELGIRPNGAIVNMIGNVFVKLDMLDKYNKLKMKYPPPKWEYKIIKGKRIRIRSKQKPKVDGSDQDASEIEDTVPEVYGSDQDASEIEDTVPEVYGSDQDASEIEDTVPEVYGSDQDASEIEDTVPEIYGPDQDASELEYCPNFGR